MNCFPHLSVAGLPGAFHSGLVLAQVMEVVASLAQLEMLVKRARPSNASLRPRGCRRHRHTKEVLHVVQTVGLLGVCKFSVNLGLAKRLAGHLEVADKVVVLAGVVCNLDKAKFEGSSALM